MARFIVLFLGAGLAVAHVRAAVAFNDTTVTGAVAVGRDNTGTINQTNIHNGLSEEQLLALFIKSQRAIVDDAQKAGLQMSTIIALAQRLKPGVLDPAQAVAELTRAVEIALDVIARGEQGTSDDAFVNVVLARVAKMIGSNDFDGGANTIDAALAEHEAEYRRSQVALLEEGVKVDTLRRNAPSVARRIEKIVAIDRPSDRPAWLPAFRTRYDEFLADGEAKGINFSLSVAIELARRMVVTARDADERGVALNLLGTALQTLGERERDTASLEEAVAAGRAALQESMGDRESLQRAKAQNNLGNTYAKLGERESDPARLTDAVDAFHLALRVWTQTSNPSEWATAQNNLGNVLQMLGKRESDPARLTDAVEAFHLALQVWTQASNPTAWAMAQMNRGNALVALGEQKSDPARLTDAVTIYTAALQVRTRDSNQFAWARTKMNLGEVLRKLGVREPGTARLKEASKAYQEALTVWKPENDPLEWADCTGGQGIAMRFIAERSDDLAMAKQALAQISVALTTFRDANHKYAAIYKPEQCAALDLVERLSKGVKAPC